MSHYVDTTMPKHGLQHQNACNIQKRVYNQALKKGTDASLLARLCHAWIELEFFKREVRGIPRLSAMSWKELDKLMAGRGRSRSKLQVIPEHFLEAEPKESLLSTTVPAPPTTETLNGQGGSS